VTTLPPIHREVLVDADPERAFAVFTDRIGHWWPLAEHGVYGVGATVGFEDGAIVERSPEGEPARWGQVTRWEPGEAVAFSWHPGGDPDKASTVIVTFLSRGAQTLVILEHSGWEVYVDPDAARSEYDQGWPPVLDRYRDDVSSSVPSTWVALWHRPGPGAPANVFADPRFADHVAFLDRMNEAGFLVAAGPLPDIDGEGLTILRLPGDGLLQRATQLATEDDLSVSGGLLAVTVRPWRVIKSA
jgi:uncharacterized protein YciI/uncharacterized protein YndB with AHSA1/START domain